jgi:hypothetical protein
MHLKTPRAWLVGATILLAGLPALLSSSTLASVGHGPSVPAALQGLARSGAISTAEYLTDESTYLKAKRSLAKLRGTRRSELGAVLANVQAIAAARELTASRLGALFLTLEKNRLWWTTRPLLAAGARLSFAPSKLIWQYYPGQGIEIQWLATFGEANGYYLAGNENASLREVLNESLTLATQRAGGIAWEYLFRFDGGAPPWTSGLSQGTALQAYSRAWSRLKEPAYLTAAQQSLGIFRVAPPVGVAVTSSPGTLYAEYTYAPGDRILNGFIQALVGLYDYTSITKDPTGLALFEAGDAEARAIVPDYNTGAWSLYDQYGESNLNYHELLDEFLQHLCERTRKGPPITASQTTTTTSGSPATTTTTTTTTTSLTSTTTVTSPGTGGTSATSSTTSTTTTTTTTSTAQAPTPIAGDQIYCTTAKAFTADLHTPPTISLLSKTLAGGVRAGVQVALSKISYVALTIRKGGRVVWRNSALVDGGRPRILWATPRAGGAFTVTLTATDLAGNGASATGTLVVRHVVPKGHTARGR